MALYKTLLIQDLGTFFEMIKDALDGALEAFVFDAEVDYDTVLRWIVQRELEEVYSLSAYNYDRQNVIYSMIRDRVDEVTNGMLSQTFSHHIGAPVLDNDYVVEVAVSGRNLMLYYKPLHDNPINRTHYIDRLSKHADTTSNFRTPFRPAANRRADAPYLRRDLQEATIDGSIFAMDP